MLIDIKSILYSKGSSLAIETEISPEELDFSNQDYRLCGPLVFRGTMQNTGKGTLALTGRIQTSYEGECARCLEPVKVDLDLEVAEIYRSIALSGAEGDEDQDCYRFEDNLADVGQAIHDNLLLALPQRLICREDCLGLCPDCGANLNEKDCGCAARRRGPASPFDQLNQLL